jgi:hypothetical protein
MLARSRLSAAVLLRPFGAALLACSVFLSGADFHPAGDAHSFADTPAPAGVSYSPAAVHPGQPLHMEASAAATRPECPFCLHRLQTSGSHLQAVAACPLPAPSNALGSGYVLATAETSRHPSEARGPPAA